MCFRGDLTKVGLYTLNFFRVLSWWTTFQKNCKTSIQPKLGKWSKFNIFRTGWFSHYLEPRPLFRLEFGPCFGGVFGRKIATSHEFWAPKKVAFSKGNGTPAKFQGKLADGEIWFHLPFETWEFCFYSRSSFQGDFLSASLWALDQL